MKLSAAYIGTGYALSQIWFHFSRRVIPLRLAQYLSRRQSLRLRLSPNMAIENKVVVPPPLYVLPPPDCWPAVGGKPAANLV